MQNDDTKKLPAGRFELLLTGGIVFTGLCRIKDPLFMCGILSAVFLLYRWRKNYFHFSSIDRFIIVLWGYSIVSLFFSIEPVSGFFAVRTFTLGIILYFLLRTRLDNTAKIENFLFMLCLSIAVVCVVAFITFLLFNSACSYVKFTGLYDFRHLYKPLGYLTNVWGSLLIGFTGIVLFSFHWGSLKKAKFVFLILLLSLLLWSTVVSFSRGVYLAFAFLLLSYSLFLVFSGIGKTRKIWIFIALTLPLFIAGCTHGQDVIKTLQFNQSLSQQRSIAGRVDAMTASYEVFQKSPLTGTGAGTYSQVINEYRYEDDDVGFTGFAPNGYTQLPVEQGIIGTILWGTLFIALFIVIFRERKKTPATIVFGITLASILIREAAFPVLLECTGFQLLFFTVAAIFQQVLPQKEAGQKPKRLHFPAAMLAAGFLIGIYSIYYGQEDQNNRKALAAMEAEQPEKAEKYIAKTSERTPYLINRSIIFSELYKKTGDTLYLNRAENCLQKAALKNPHDVMIPYYQASVLREKGKKDAALSILTETVQKFPNKSLYQLSVFDLLHKNGQREKAFPYLLQAVKRSPDLLDRSYIKDILSRDSTTNDALKTALLQHVSPEKDSDDPVFLAKSGKIFLSFGREEEAKACLEKAVRLLPNLIYPRYYLSQIENGKNNPGQSIIYAKQFVLLSSAALSKTMIDQTTASGEMETPLARRKDITDNSYTAKFQTWYHTSTVLKQLIE